MTTNTKKLVQSINDNYKNARLDEEQKDRKRSLNRRHRVRKYLRDNKTKILQDLLKVSKDDGYLELKHYDSKVDQRFPKLWHFTCKSEVVAEVTSWLMDCGIRGGVIDKRWTGGDCIDCISIVILLGR